METTETSRLLQPCELCKENSKEEEVAGQVTERPSQRRGEARERRAEERSVHGEEAQDV